MHFTYYIQIDFFLSSVSRTNAFILVDAQCNIVSYIYVSGRLKCIGIWFLLLSVEFSRGGFRLHILQKKHLLKLVE